MYIKRLFLFIVLAITIYGCVQSPKKDVQYKSFYSAAPANSTAYTPKPYKLTETFEIGKKTKYASADIPLVTGSWNFSDAIIGTRPTDKKSGEAACRIRNGAITMNFDVYDVNQIIIKHAKYGSDKKSAWQLLISANGGENFLPLSNSITETNDTLKTDTFIVNIKGRVRFQVKKSGSARINIDDITFIGLGDPGIIAGMADTVKIDTATSKSTAKSRGVIIGPDVPPAIGDNSNLLFGNPSNATTNMVMKDNYLMDMGYYVESYNNSRGGPNWVSWHLDATNITTNAKRVNNFAAFSDLPKTFYPVQNTSYTASGFDRGHNCPSADRSSSANANAATFLMVNMIPQVPKNNQQTWGKFENYLRVQVLAGNEVYIIMGSYGKGGTGTKGYFTTIDKGRITVPSNIWKVAVIIPAGNNDVNRVTNKTRVIAIDTPNNNTINPDWTRYIVTVDMIEKITGYDLLSNLPKNIQDVIESKADSGKY
ncbi:MAG: DNA/RNA non-specific endonuclease [Sphingobacteriaceae bacterium]|nr:MAG: DNA/RNA non-specific endonuclease [Sphingobacteriaceae bacterium]